MVNIKKNFLVVAYLTSFLVATPSQPNIPQQPIVPSQPLIINKIVNFFDRIFGGGSNGGPDENNMSQKFWDAVKLTGGFLPSDEELEAMGIPADSNIWNQYSKFFEMKGEEILSGKMSPEAISSALDYFRGS